MRVDIVYFEAGSGHRTAAWALQHQLQEQHPDWSVRSVDISEIFDHCPILLGTPVRWGVAGLNHCMRRESYLGFTPLIWTTRWWVRFLSRWRMTRSFCARTVARFWKENPPDCVISTTPLLSAMVYQAARLRNQNVHCITIPVDHTEMCGGYWFVLYDQQHYLVANEELRERAIQHGISPSDLTMISGMMIDARFYDRTELNRTVELDRLGLDPQLKTVVIHFGGQGTVNVLRVAQQLIDRQLPVNIICLCGRNESLYHKCRAIKSPHPILPLQHMDGPPVLQLRLADVLVGKPGTLTLNEALITQTPFVFVKSTGLSPIQQGNETWMLERGVGNVAESVSQVGEVVETVLSQEDYPQHAARYYHRGLFDVIDHIERL